MESRNGKIMGFIFAGVAPAILFFIVTSISGWAGGLPETGPVEKANQPAAKGKVRDLPILQKWSGDFPVAQIERLPADQRGERVGYIGDPVIFVAGGGLQTRRSGSGSGLCQEPRRILPQYPLLQPDLHRQSDGQRWACRGVGCRNIDFKASGGQGGHGHGRNSPRRGGIYPVGG